MSFILEFGGRTQVAFKVPDGSAIDFDPSGSECLLNINRNLWFDMKGLASIQDHDGNFSKWMTLEANQGIAVTGLTSCGAIFFANADFSRVAAGHMSGDAVFTEAWCDYLGQRLQPFYLIFGTGFDGSARIGGAVLMQYMKAFEIPPSRAPAVKGCGKIFVCRSEDKKYGIVCATRSGVLMTKNENL